MILLLASTAAAALPWECPPVTIPADADPYRNEDGDLDDEIDALYAAARAWWDDGCAWVETTTSDGYTERTERVCAEADRTVTWTESVTHESWPERTVESWTLTVDLPAGESWTSITVSETDQTWSTSGLTYGGGHSRTASWAGSFDALPDDGSLGYASSYDNTTSSSAASISVWTPTCSWSWSDWSTLDGYRLESVHAPDHDVTVESAYIYDCPDPAYAHASLDGEPVGAVDRDTWVLDPSDLDGDGWTSANDCDETDPARNACQAWDVANDGVDQDCDGADRIDGDVDNDGHDGPAFGGADCDDDDPYVFPGADENAGDGLDQDCDGADDVDADADGYTADGDDDPADCDDANNRVHPGRIEIPYDGVDDDCDGADLTDVDRDGEDAAVVGGPDCDDTDRTVYSTAPEVECDGIDQDCDGADECPPPAAAAPEPDPAEPEEEPTGCAGGAALLLLLPLGYRRRR